MEQLIVLCLASTAMTYGLPPDEATVLARSLTPADPADLTDERITELLLSVALAAGKTMSIA